MIRRLLRFALAFSLMMCLAVPTAVSAAQTPGPILGPYSGNGHYYQIVLSDSPVTWTSALTDAASLPPYLGASPHLATITSSGEQAYLAGLPGAGTYLWLGASEAATEGVWTWVTGEAFGFTNWLAGEPNNSGGDEDYLEWNAGGWNDNLNLTRVIGYFVEYDVKPPSINPSSVSANLLITDPPSSVTINKTIQTPAIPPNPDIVFMSDTTGSMGPAIANVQANMVSIMSTVLASSPNAQFAVAQYKNSGDPFIFQLDQAITSNTTLVTNAINAWFAGGGGDTPEGQLYALNQVATLASIGFRSGSTRIIVWMGDNPGHDPSFGITEAIATTNLLTGPNSPIRVIAVPVIIAGELGLDSTSQATRITAATGGVLLPAATPAQVATAILTGLQNLPITVSMTTDCTAPLSVSFLPASQNVISGSVVNFTETITLASNALPGVYTGDDWVLIDGNPMTDAAGNIIKEHKSITAVGGTLKIFKFNDYNGSGSQDAGELPLQNWTFLTTGPGGYTNTSNTDSSGFITLSNIAPGNYTTTETVIPGWRLTTPPNPKTATVTSGQITGLSFGNQQLGSLKIFKFEDKNWNKVKDPTEPVLPGWGFNISGPGGYSSSGVTDSSGLITLTNLVPGVYNVTEIPKPGGWIPTNGAGIRSAMVPPGGVATVEFGNEILPQTPASSNLGIGLMIGGFTGIMALFILRRHKSHQGI